MENDEVGGKEESKEREAERERDGQIEIKRKNS